MLSVSQLATGEWKLLQGLGKGAELEAKCDYRVEECLTMARVLQAMQTGEGRRWSRKRGGALVAARGCSDCSVSVEPAG
jgi:hypothetical protein